MRLKRLIAVILSLSILFVLSILMHSTVQAASIPQIMVNNRTVSFYTAPEYFNGILMAPAKEIAESLGGSFSYSESNGLGSLRVGNNELSYRIDDNVVCHNGRNIYAASPMKIINNRFMVPVVFTAQKLGAAAYTHYISKAQMIMMQSGDKLIYKVMQGDSLWIISKTFNIPISTIKQINNLSSDIIYTGQNLNLGNYPASKTSFEAVTASGATIRTGAGFDFGIAGYLGTNAPITVTGKNGDWYKISSTRGNGYIYYTTVKIKQDITFTKDAGSYFGKHIPVDTSMDSISYTDYTVVRGDSLWSISLKYSIQEYELAAANKMTTGTVLYPGQVIKIPVHKIAIKKTPGAKYGEVLDWYTQARYVFPIGKKGRLTDLATGKSFDVMRTMGANHADTEPLTAKDSAIMKEIFGGSWIWTRRPFILEVDGRRFAVSVAGMPHGGVDGKAYLENVENRSYNYGYGPNYDYIAGNGMDGHFDLYFLNGVRHYDNTIDEGHQFNVLVAGGLR